MPEDFSALAEPLDFSRQADSLDFSKSSELLQASNEPGDESLSLEEAAQLQAPVRVPAASSLRQAGRAFVEPFRTSIVGTALPFKSDEALKEHLRANFNAFQEEEPGAVGKTARLAGGVAGSIANYVAFMTATRSRVGPAVAFGSSGAYEAFMHAGLRALAEDKTPDEALSIAKKASIVGAAVGAGTAAIGPSAVVGVKTALQAAGLMAAAGAGGRAAENLTEKALGLTTPVMEGVPEAAITMGALPLGHFALSRGVRSIQARLRALRQQEQNRQAAVASIGRPAVMPVTSEGVVKDVSASVYGPPSGLSDLETLTPGIVPAEQNAIPIESSTSQVLRSDVQGQSGVVGLSEMAPRNPEPQVVAETKTPIEPGKAPVAVEPKPAPVVEAGVMPNPKWTSIAWDEMTPEQRKFAENKYAKDTNDEPRFAKASDWQVNEAGHVRPSEGNVQIGKTPKPSGPTVQVPGVAPQQAPRPITITPATNRYKAGIRVKQAGKIWQLVDAATGKSIKGTDVATQDQAIQDARNLHQMLFDVERDSGKAATVPAPAKSIPIEQARTTLDELRSSETVKVPIRYTLVDDAGLLDSRGNVRAAYVTMRDGQWQMLLNAAGISSPRELAGFVFHEWTHIGLPQVLGDAYTARLLDLAGRPELQDQLRERALTYGFATETPSSDLAWRSTDRADADLNKVFAMEEVVAAASEEQLQAGPIATFLNWVKDQFRGILGKFTGKQWADTDVRNLIRDSREYLRNNSTAERFEGGRGALVPTAESAQRALEVGELAGPNELERRAKGILGQVTTIREALDRFRPPDLDAQVRGAVDKLLGYDELFGAEQSATRVVDPRDFYANQQEFSEHPIRHVFGAEAGMRWLLARAKLNSVITQHADLVEQMQRPGHVRFMERVEKTFNEAHELEGLVQSFNADVSAAIANTKDIIEKRAYQRGQEDQYVQQLRSLESKQQYGEAVRSTVRDIVETLSRDQEQARRFGFEEVEEGPPEQRKVSAAEAITMLPGSPGFITEMLQQYRRLKPEGRPDAAVEQWAAETIQRSFDQANVLANMMALRRDAKIRKAYDDLTLYIADQMARNPRATARKIIGVVSATSTKAERAMGRWRILNRKVVALAKDLDAIETAADMARATMADPFIQQYERDVLAAGKIQDRPDHAIDQNPDNLEVGGPSGVVLPDGQTTGPIDLSGDPIIWVSSAAKLTNAVGQISEWLTTNPDSTFAPYWTGLRNTLRDVYLGARVMAPEKLSQPFHQWGAWGMTRTFLDNLGTRVGGVAKIALANHERADALAKAIVSQQSSRLVNAVFLAAKSHDFLGGVWSNLRSGRSKLQGIEHWVNEVFRDLADSWQNEAGGLDVGDRVGGHEITKADMAALELISHDVIGKGFKSLQETAQLGRETSTAPFIIDTMANTGIKAVRQSVEVSRYTLTRRFSPDAVDFVRKFQEANASRRAQILDLNFWDIVRSHVGDRANVYFDGKSRFEDPYRVMAADIKQNGLALSDRNMAWLVRRIDQLAGDSIRPEETQPYVEAGIAEPRRAFIRDVVTGEFDTMTKRLAAETVPEPSPTDVETEAKANQFTKSRKVKLAGAWLYRYGVTNTSELMGFAKAMSGFHYERAAASLRRVGEDLQKVHSRLQDALKAEANRTGTTPQSVMGRVKQQNREALRLGKTLDDFEQNEFDIKQAKTIEELFRRVYGAGNNIDFGDALALKKLQGVFIGNALLQHVTAIRNAFGALAKDGRMLNTYQGTLVSGYFKAAWDFAWHGVLPYGARMAGNIIKIPFYDLIYAGPKAALSSIQKREGKAAIGRFFEPMIFRLTQGNFERNKTYRDMADRGYAPRVSILDDILARARLPSEGGAIVGGGKNIFQNRAARLVFGGLELLDSLLAAPKSLFPGASDRIINTAGQWSAQRVVSDLEVRLRKTFDTYRRAGVERFDFDNLQNPRNALQPEEVFGRFMMLKRTRNDLARLNQLFEWWGGPDLQALAMRYMKQLRDAPDGATLMTPEETMAFGSKWADDLNVSRATNRPLPFKLNDIPHQMMSALNGWNAQDFQQWVRFASRTKRDANFSRFALWAATIPTVAALLAAGAGTDVAQEEVIRPITKLLTNEDRATRQPWERDNPGTGWALSSANQIPFLQTLVNLMFNDMPNKGVSDPQIFMLQKAKDITRYVSGVMQTGDPTFGFQQAARALLPASVILLNRLPETEGSVEALNARRLLTRYGPQDLLQTKQAPSSAVFTPLSPLIERALNAAVKGDDAGFTAARAEFIQKATELGRPDPEALFRQAYGARNPYSRAFRATLTPEQRSDMLGRMSPDERATVERVEQNFARAGSAAGSNVKFQKSQPAGGGAARTQRVGLRGRGGRARGFGRRIGRSFGRLPRLARGR